jgi:hypothetical protein
MGVINRVFKPSLVQKYARNAESGQQKLNSREQAMGYSFEL